MKFVIIDNSLLDQIGHHFEYDAVLAGALRARGHSVTLYGHRDLDFACQSQLQAVPAFPKSEYQEHRPLPFDIPFFGALAGNISFFRTLVGTKVHLWDPDVVFDHTITPVHMIGLFAWRTWFFRKKKTVFVVLLRFDLRNRRSGMAYKVAFLARKILPGSVTFVTDSDLLAETFSPLAGQPVHVLPIPHAQRTTAPEKPSSVTASGVTVAYLGVASENKGFHFLPEAVGRLLAEGASVRFLIQTVLPSPTPAHRETVNRLESFGDAVRLIDRPLSSEEYHGILRDADCVLLPYDPRFYGGQTSGIFTETVALGKIVLATRTKWMERSMQRFDTGVFIEEFSAAGILKAIERYLGNRKREEERAARAAERWCAYHNPDSYVEHLLRACGLERPAGAANGRG